MRVATQGARGPSLAERLGGLLRRLHDDHMSDWEPMDPYEPDRRFLTTVVWLAAGLAVISVVIAAVKRFLQ
jgi:hypothetical protein